MSFFGLYDDDDTNALYFICYTAQVYWKSRGGKILELIFSIDDLYRLDW